MEDNNYQYYDVKNPFEPQKRRPVGLTVLCVLTLIGSGFNILSNAMWIFMGKYMASMQMPGLFQNEQVKEMIDIMSNTAPWKYGVIALLYLVSLVGAIFMLYLKKLGFHLYTAAQVLLLFLPSFLIFNHIKPDLFSLLFTVTFVVLYGVHYKYMTWNLNDEQETLNENDTDTNNDEQ
jgi:hypothetical protein